MGNRLLPGSGRIRLEPIRSNGRESLHPFVFKNTLPATTIFTDGNPSYQGIPGRIHQSQVVKGMPAHIWFKRIHRVFSLMKRWMMGVYHGVQRRHFDIYLQEFIFRWNRRRHFSAAFDSLLSIGNGTGHVGLRQIAGRPPVLKTLMEQVRDGTKVDHRRTYLEAIAKGVPNVFAQRLLDRDYVAPEPRIYRRKTTPRPVLAKSRSDSYLLLIDNVLKVEHQASRRRYRYPLCRHHRCHRRHQGRLAHMRLSAVRP
ncbi:ISXO2-like transposase domain (plasmid) [Hoeflea sp. IMCC20628]|nr:ISXO2-like transposase domain [Hoeflea sp. IMCC20628]